MLKIFKYPVPIGDYFELQLPAGARPLTIACQHGIPQLWALVDPSREPLLRRFRCAGTGHPITEPVDRLRFVATFPMEGGLLIFHVFEVLP